jgi:putative N6-adenine-specific DNA methylase
MNVFDTPSSVLVTCPRGAASVCAEELSALGFPVHSQLSAAVETTATLRECMRLNLYLRTAHRVQFVLKQFNASNADQMYAQVHAVPWELWIAPDGYLSIGSHVVNNDSIRDTRFANVRVKDAIVDRMRAKFDRRPDSGPESTGTVVFLHWSGDDCTLYLDTSGEPLNRRGYRKIPCRAPMQETLAAATILASGWKGDTHFVNPMCGSGTLAIEAALIALNSAPGLMRENYGFMHVPGYDPADWDALLDEAEANEKGELSIRIIATDIDRPTAESAYKNAMEARVERYIQFGACDFAETPIPEEGGMIIMNPPYGERLGDKETLGTLYAGIGDFFKQRCAGYMGYVFTGNPDLAKQVGLRTKRKLPFYTAKIECRLLEYELYGGTRKQKD